MRDINTKTREISFVSTKDNLQKTVTNDFERTFAITLDADENVISYDCSVILEDINSRVSLRGIRTRYRNVEWASSFYVRYKNGERVVYEIVCESWLEKLTVIEKLELSRRYWSAVGTVDWKMVVVRGK